MITDDVREFARTILGSVWAIKLVMRFRETPEQAWSPQALTHDLRASATIVSQLLPRLQSLGLVIEAEPGLWKWSPVDPEVDKLAARLCDAFKTTPVAVISSIADGPSDNVQALADVFRLRKDRT